MPRYFFHVHDGVDRPDREGTVLSGIEAARIEGLRLAGEIIRDAGIRGSSGKEWRVEITDDEKSTLFRLEFTVVESPVMARDRHRDANLGASQGHLLLEPRLR